MNNSLQYPREDELNEVENVPQGKAMSILDHLEELRWLIVRCCLAFIVGCVIVGSFFPYFAKLLLYPLNKAIGTGGTPLLQGLVTTSPMGIFSVIIQICLLGGLTISLPVMLYFIAKYINPGLRREEKSLIVPGSIAIICLFLVGAGFSYFYIIPASLAVAIHLNEIVGFQLIWSASTYYSMVVWMTLGVGFCFEFLLALLLLIQLGILSTDKLRRIRRHMIVIVLVAAGLITPSSDPFSLMLLAVPLYLLYEGAMLVGRRIERKRARVVEEE